MSISFPSPSGDLAFKIELVSYHRFSVLEVCSKFPRAECTPREERAELATLSVDDYTSLLEVFRNTLTNAEDPRYFRSLEMCREALAGRLCRVEDCPLSHSVAERIARGFTLYPDRFSMQECAEENCSNPTCCDLHIGEWEVTVNERKDLVFRKFVNEIPASFFNFLSDEEEGDGEVASILGVAEAEASSSPAQTTERSDS